MGHGWQTECQGESWLCVIKGKGRSEGGITKGGKEQRKVDLKVNKHQYLIAADAGIAKPKRDKLEQLMTFSLQGNVMSLQTASLSNNGREALLLSFKDAKVCHICLDSPSFPNCCLPNFFPGTSFGRAFPSC